MFEVPEKPEKSNKSAPFCKKLAKVIRYANEIWHDSYNKESMSMDRASDECSMEAVEKFGLEYNLWIIVDMAITGDNDLIPDWCEDSIDENGYRFSEEGIAGMKAEMEKADAEGEDGDDTDEDSPNLNIH